MCLQCIRLAGAFEPDWPDMNPSTVSRGSARLRPALFCADGAVTSLIPDGPAETNPSEARERS
jgi:hypothetical protein